MADDVDAPPEQQQRQGILQWLRNDDALPLSMSTFLMFVLCTLACDWTFLLVAKALACALLFSGCEDSPDTWPRMQALLEHTSEALWLLPALVLTKVMSCLSFQELADIAYRAHPRVPRTTMPTLSDLLANAWFGVAFPTLFLLQSHLLSMLAPGVLGSFVSTVHLSLLYSFSAFEYVWFSRGWAPHRRVSFVEDNWPYFVGFGMPLAFVTSLSGSLCIRRILFSIAFPLLFMSSLAATPNSGTPFK
ncbi:etoposide-induced protein 2.4 homolog [Amblyomma americanum]